METPQIHQGRPVERVGAPLDSAEAVMILLHGRGAGAHGILSLAQEINLPKVAYLAPEAQGATWYPNRFIVPRAQNEPHLSSALSVVHDLIDEVVAHGIAAEKIIVLGFSQGACLAVESVARKPQQYGGAVALSGGLIGAQDEMNDYEGDLAGTPIFLGCSDMDFHIPVDRVHESTRILNEMGASVDERIYPGMGHTVNMDELEAVRALVRAVIER